MRIWLSQVIAALASVVLVTPNLDAQAVLIGIVRNDSTGRALPGVEVLLSGTTYMTVTSSTGRYLLTNLPVGRHQVIFRIIGYIPSRVEVLLASGDTLRVNQVMAPSTVVLDPIEVAGVATTELAGLGFEERKRMGFGRFYDSEELRKLEHLKLDDVLRRKGGLQVVLAPRLPNKPWVAMSSRYRDLNGQLNCYMSIYLDGHLLFRGTNQLGPEDLNSKPPPDLREILGVHQVAAIEVYSGTGGTPVEFGGAGGQCGAVVLWTRRGPDR